MELFLIHCLGLFWLSIGASRQLVKRVTDQLLAAALLAWGNITATSLLLSWAHRLSDPRWFLGLSLIIAATTCLLLIRTKPEHSTASAKPAESQANGWLLLAFVATMVPMVLANLAIAYTYQPNHPDALTWQLPRAMYYLGQNSLWHFDAADLRQIYLPFNFNLLQLFGLIYSPPLQCLNFFNLLAWIISGLAIYRLCRQLSGGVNVSLLTTWLALTAPLILTGATSSIPELASGAALACAGVFTLKWQRSGQQRHAVLAGLALGLAAGSSLLLFFLTPILIFGTGWLLRKQAGLLRNWVLPMALTIGISTPFAVINLMETGKLLEPTLVLAQCRSAGWKEFLPLLLILSPSVAILFEMLAGYSRFRRGACWTVGLALALGASWGGGNNLLRNSSQPLAPLLKGGLVPSGQPTLPLLLEFRIKDQPLININTDGANECIFPIMATGHQQRFTSHSQVVPTAYNIFSRAQLSRNLSYKNTSKLPSYILLPIPAKRSAGVEFLGEVGGDQQARDYFGLAAQAGKLKPFDANRNLLITLYNISEPTTQTTNTRITVAGLNLEDQARLIVIQENADGRTAPLATFYKSGETHVLIDRPFARLLFKVVDNSNGSEIGITSLPFLPTAAESRAMIDSLQPTSSSSIFVTDAIALRNSNIIADTGLLPIEGPFFHWDLPYRFRWAKQPSVRLTIPKIPNLARLVLSLSVQPQVRHEAELDVLFNGKLVGHYQLKARTVWMDQTLELIPQAGINVLELNDATFTKEPDWIDYLARYPDVKNYLEANNFPIEAGARDHFASKGQAEGRTLRMRTTNRLEPAPESYYFIYRSIRLEGFTNP